MLYQALVLVLHLSQMGMPEGGLQCHVWCGWLQLQLPYNTVVQCMGQA